MRKCYWIKRRPSSFAVVSPEGKTLDDPRIFLLNQHLKAGMPRDRVELQIRQVVEELNEAALERPNPYLDCHPDNVALLDRYWKEEFGRRARREPRAARNRMNRAIRAVGRLSLLSAGMDELQAAISELPTQQQKPRAAALNQLLRWAGRKHKLYYQPQAEPDPVAISLQDLEKLCEATTPERALFFRVAFATGGRASELLAPWFQFEQGGDLYVRITRQRLKGALRPRKAGKMATSRVVPELASAVRNWTEEGPPLSVHSERRSEWVRAAALKAGLPPMTFHNFRHSYARYWSEKGVDLTQLSIWLGDSIVVVEKYYRGWQLRVA